MKETYRDEQRYMRHQAKQLAQYLESDKRNREAHLEIGDEAIPPILERLVWTTPDGRRFLPARFGKEYNRHWEERQQIEKAKAIIAEKIQHDQEEAKKRQTLQLQRQQMRPPRITEDAPFLSWDEYKKKAPYGQAVTANLLEPMPVKIQDEEWSVGDVIDDEDLFTKAMGAASRKIYDQLLLSGESKTQAIEEADAVIGEISSAREFSILAASATVSGHPDRKRIRIEGRAARAFVAGFVHDNFGESVLDVIHEGIKAADVQVFPAPQHKDY